jgi:MFS transporter, PAT family, beta-lactamase induction signal transducer AmpG
MIARHARCEFDDLTAGVKPRLREALGDKRMMAILFLGFASGLPFNLTAATMQAWLTSLHIDIKTIGMFALVGLPYSFKFLWAPLLDRFLPPLLGRRRGWILIYQLSLVIAIAVLGSASPTQDLTSFAAMAVIVAFLSASQDIVIDAYRVDSIPPTERALAAGVTTVGYRSAAMFASALLLPIAHRLGWRLAYFLIAFLMLLTVTATIRAPEPQQPGRPPRTLRDAVVEPLKDLLNRKGIGGFLVLALLYKAGDAFALSLYSAFMLGVGFSLDQLSLGKADMFFSTLVGTALGGWVYMRWGMFRSLLVFGIGQACTNLMYMWLALAGKKLWLMVLATSIDTGIGGMGQAAFVAFLVSQCSASFSATQYALLSAFATLPSKILSSFAGYVVASVGWAHFFVITFLTAVPGLAVLLFLRRPLSELEAREVASARS